MVKLQAGTARAWLGRHGEYYTFGGCQFEKTLVLYKNCLPAVTMYPMNDIPPNKHEQLLAHFNAQTARLGWSELVRHFARGVVVKVAPELDLVTVAAAMSQDRADEVDAWSRAGRIQRASDDDARDWHECDSVFWAVVVAPWVLVQEIRNDSEK